MNRFKLVSVASTILTATIIFGLIPIARDPKPFIMLSGVSFVMTLIYWGLYLRSLRLNTKQKQRP
jgi:hypothetical protein